MTKKISATTNSYWSLSVFFGLFLLAFFSCSSAMAAGGMPEEAVDAMNLLLECRDPSAPVPQAHQLEPLLDYVYGGTASYDATKPPKRPEGSGIFWRDSFSQPMKNVLEYMYNPAIPTEASFPALVRSGRWLEGSDILKLPKPLWESLDNLSQPVVLRGVEEEEITPDSFSGSYYSYQLDRLLILMEYKGAPMLVSVVWQKDKSDVGRKGGFVGDYNNWDFIYTPSKGATLKGVGWADTYMYDTCSISFLFPEGPSRDKTAFAIFKWLKAGWSGMNMVERSHIRDGMMRSVRSLKSVIEPAKRPSPSAIAQKYKELSAKSEEELCSLATPYCQALAVKSSEKEVFSDPDFQAVLKDGNYVKTMEKRELIALLMVNYLKEQLGKPVLK